MSWTVPTITRFSPGEFPSAAKMNAVGVTAIGSFLAPPSCSLYSTGGLTILTGGAGSRLTWNAEEYDDPDAMHSTASNTDRVTIVTAGRYLAVLNTVWTASVFSGWCESRINAQISGTPRVLARQSSPMNSDNVNPTATHSVTVEVALSAGDYLFASCVHNHAGSMTLDGGQYVGTRMSARRLGS